MQHSTHILYTITLLLALIAGGVFPMNAVQAEEAQCFKIGTASHLGFIDRAGRVVQSPSYQYCGRWQSGMLWVRESVTNRFSGRFVNHHGRLIAQDLFGDISDVLFEMPDPEFCDGVAFVAIEAGKYAFINMEGRILGLTSIPIFAGRFGSAENLFAVRNGDKYGFVDKKGDFLIPARFEDARSFRHGFASARVHGKWGLIGRDGEFRVHPNYDELDWFREDPTCWKSRVGEHWGLIDQLGNELVAAKYMDIERCKNGITTARTKDGHVILNLSGQAAVRPKTYEALGSIGDGVVLAKVDGKWGVVSAKEESIVPFRFNAVSGFREDGLCEVREGGRVGLLDHAGRLICEPVCQRILSPSYGMLPVQRGGKWGIIDVEGEILVEPQYERIKGYESFKDGLAIVRNDNGWGLLRLTYKELAVACAYTDINRWNDLFAAQKKDVYTLFNMAGEEIVSAELGIADLPKPHDMVRGYGVVRAKSSAGVITRSGVLVLSLEYEDAGIPCEGLIPIKKDGLWGYLDMGGAVAIAPQFTEAGSFREGVAAVKVSGKYGYIDRTGKELLLPSYADAGYSLHGLLPVARWKKADGVDALRWGLINHQGEVVLPLEYECLEWGDIEENETRFYGRICWQQP